jgi:hypothetical protein
MTRTSKAKRPTDKLKPVRNYANHLGLHLRRRGTGYSLYGWSVGLDGRTRSDTEMETGYAAAGRIDFQKLSQIDPWLDKWANDLAARLKRDGRRC